MTFIQVTNVDVVQYLVKEALFFSEVSCGNIISDLFIDGKKMYDWFNSDKREPYYVCIRRTGTETGSLEEVRERCAALGKPIRVYEITSCKNVYCIDKRTEI